MSSADPASPAPFRRRIAIALVVAAALAAGLWWFFRPAPAKLLKEALSASRNDPDRAEQLFRRALEAAGGRYPDAQIALCRLEGSRGAWDEALDLFAHTEKPECRADLLLDFGRMAYEAGHRQAALEALGEVRRRGSRESLEAIQFLMSDYRDWELHDELIEAARELVRLEPHNPERRLELVDLLAAMKLDEECIAELREGIANDDLPEELRRDLRHRYIDRLIRQGDAQSARREWDELSREEGRSLRVCADEIDIDRLDGNLDQALATVTEVFPQIKQQYSAYVTRGGIYLDMGRFAEAARDLERGVAGKPGDESIQFKLAEAYRGLGKQEAALKHREIATGIAQKRTRIDKLLQELVSDSQNSKHCEELAELHRELDEPEAAERWRQRAARAASRKSAN
jgi:tetratricopeptide (TPR) repeat protein